MIRQLLLFYTYRTVEQKVSIGYTDVIEKQFNMFGLFKDICPTTMLGGTRLKNNDTDINYKLYG